MSVSYNGPIRSERYPRWWDGGANQSKCGDTGRIVGAKKLLLALREQSTSLAISTAMPPLQDFLRTGLTKLSGDF
jgi:hypothetical protein